MSDSWWENLHRKAKALEVRLEKRLQSYSSLAQRINANFICDEENSLLENNEEQILTSDIERDLGDLHECIQQMRQGNGSILSSQQEAWIKRYYEIHFDYSTEFRNTAASIQRKRESVELLNNNRKFSHEEKDSSMSKLLKEKMSIAASMRSINEVLSQAFETKGSLLSQRNSISNASGGLGNITNSVPGIGRLIEGIQKKKYRETLIIGGVVAGLICFTIWWMFMR